MIFGAKKKENADYAPVMREMAIAFKRVFGTPDGKTVLFEILNRCNVLETHNGDAFKEGRRSVALLILHNLHMNIEQLDKLLATGETE